MTPAMTAYCLSSTSRSRPSLFTLACSGAEKPLPEQPVPPTHSVDTPDDTQIEQPNPGDPGPPVLLPPKKPHLPDPNRAD